MSARTFNVGAFGEVLDDAKANGPANTESVRWHIGQGLVGSPGSGLEPEEAVARVEAAEFLACSRVIAPPCRDG